MKLPSKENPNWVFGIIVPTFSVNKKLMSKLDGEVTETQINFDNHFQYTRCDNYWYVSITILGFGFFLSKQWGY